MQIEANGRAWAYSTVELAGRHRFQIVYGDEELADADPVAGTYRAGTLSHLGTLLDLALVTLSPGDRVLDLGAHLGGFALSAAALGCEVLAVEASPYNAALLQLSATHNHFQKLEVIQAAVTEQSGSVEFSVYGPYGHVATPATGIPAMTVPATTVDELLEERRWSTVQFVKMDVEGSEVRAVRGMRGLLGGSDAPLLFFESNKHTLGFYGETDEELRSELRRLGYVIYEVRRGELMRVGAGEQQSSPVTDYLAAKHLPPRLAAWEKAARSPLRRLARVFGLKQKPF